MRNKITMEMSICQAENGFSLDELVKKVADSITSGKSAHFLCIVKIDRHCLPPTVFWAIKQ